MSQIEQSIEVNVPVATAYNQWTQFEQFPQFMETIEEVRQLDDKHLHWVAEDRRQELTSGMPRSPSRSPTSGSPGDQPTAPAIRASSPSIVSPTTAAKSWPRSTSSRTESSKDR